MSRRVRQSGRYRGCSRAVAADREGPARNAGRPCQQHPAWPAHHPLRPPDAVRVRIDPTRRRSARARRRRTAPAAPGSPGRRRPRRTAPMRSTTSLVGARQHARPHEVGQAAELLPEALLGPGQAHVDRGADLGRVAADVGAVGVEHVALVGERLGRDEGHVPAVGPAARRCAACAARRGRRPRSAARPARAWARSGPRAAGTSCPSKSVTSSRSRPAHALDRLLELVHADRRPAGTGCRRRRTRSGSSRRRGRGRPARPRGGRWCRWRWPARPGGGSRRSTRASRTAPRSVSQASAAWVATASRHSAPSPRVGRVEVVPDRDPVEAEVLDAPPQGRAARRSWCSAGRRAPRRRSCAGPYTPVGRSGTGAVQRIDRSGTGGDTLAHAQSRARQRDRDRVRDLRSTRRPALLLVMGFSAQLIAWDDGSAQAPRRRRASTSSASTTATAACRPSSTASRSTWRP